MALILLRHLRPEGGEGLCYGRADLAPAPCGAVGAAARVGRLPPFARVITSPLRRCRRLAALLAGRAGVPLHVDPRWAEIDFGAWEGRSWEALPRAEIDAWARDLLHARAHGGESVAMLLARVRRALARTPRRGSTLVVTHAGPIRAALVASGAGPVAWQRRVGFGEWVALGGRPALTPRAPGHISGRRTAAPMNADQ